MSSYLIDRSPKFHVQKPSNLHELDCPRCKNPMIIKEKEKEKLKLIMPCNYILVKHMFMALSCHGMTRTGST
ncbi:hypothetical protein NC652_027484 [Populus alba x Populus x berolinensis]|nr:hypothetical protein NC652_027484 [Populus alba x Populus x berolinensis]